MFALLIFVEFVSEINHQTYRPLEETLGLFQTYHLLFPLKIGYPLLVPLIIFSIKTLYFIYMIY
jgi:hypothetical protein